MLKLVFMLCLLSGNHSIFTWYIFHDYHDDSAKLGVYIAEREKG